MTPEWCRSNEKRKHVLTAHFLARFGEPAMTMPGFLSEKAGHMKIRPSTQLEADAAAVNILIGGLTGQPEIPVMRRRFSDADVMVVQGSRRIHEHHSRIGASSSTRGGTDPEVPRTAV